MSKHFDVIIIGGGINGAGIARDLALRGIKTLLLEKNDFGSGTTAYSTRLIHGGLRYLAQMDFGLVFESLQERKILLNIANHLVFPLPFILPVYKGQKYGPWTLKIGLVLYDILALHDSLPNHRMLSKDRVLERVNALNKERLKCGFQYLDCQVPLPERLTLENVLDAETHGALCLNYTPVTTLRQQNHEQFLVEAFDREADETLQFTGKVIINAAGPWVNEVAALVDEKKPKLVGGTKGSHLLVENRIRLQEAVYAPARSDGRPFFIIPFAKEQLLIGTTDIFFKEPPEKARATYDEVGYLMAEANQLCPDLGLTEKDVQWTYAGVRPLPPAHGENAGEITRKHEFYIHKIAGRKSRVFSIIGGKITTYRHLAEEAADLVLKMLQAKRVACLTGKRKLPGAFENKVNHGKDFSEATYAAQSHKPLLLFGRHADEIFSLSKRKPEWGHSLLKGQDEPAAQVLFSARKEKVKHLEDFMLRRTLLGMKSGGDPVLAKQVADLLKSELGWTQERAQKEVNAYLEKIKDAMHWQKS